MYIMFLKKKIKKLTEERWNVGFIQNSIEDILNNSPLKVNWIKHNYKNSWFADPFILDVTEKKIELLVEEFFKPANKGRISKLTIDRASNDLQSCDVILDLTTHLSFPFIIRQEDPLSFFIRDIDTHVNSFNEPYVYILPENGESGHLSIYRYFPLSNKIAFLYNVLDESVEDAVPFFIDNQTFLFCTPRENPNGNILHIYKWLSEEKKFVFLKSLSFKENVARMSGAFFYYNNKLIRPTQECNLQYGHAVTLQETNIKNFSFKELRRIYSTHPTLNVGSHTFNSYKNIIVTDTLGFDRMWIRKILKRFNLI